MRIPVSDPIKAQLLVTRLQDRGIPAQFLNEASYIVGVSLATDRVMVEVPREFDEKAAKALQEFSESTEELPEDAEFEYEDGEDQERLSSGPFIGLKLWILAGALILWLLLMYELARPGTLLESLFSRQ